MKQDTETKGKTETIDKVVHKYHSRNPFIKDVAVHIQSSHRRKIVGSKWQDVMDTDTGELSKQKITVFGEKKQVDKQSYMKLFIGEIKRFFDLSKTSMKLLEYIMDNIRWNKDKICMHQPTIMDDMKISRTTCYRSMIQLLDAGIIAKADTDGCYYVNPTVVFKGDRIILYTEYEKMDMAEDPYKGMPKMEQSNESRITYKLQIDEDTIVEYWTPEELKDIPAVQIQEIEEAIKEKEETSGDLTKNDGEVYGWWKIVTE